MLCFVDGFGLYCNMYRSLMGVYLTLASMNLRQRSRRANMFPLTLGPHGSNFSDVISSIVGLAQLDKGIEIEINGEKKFVCVYILAFTGDMPQQQENSGFKRQSANRGCRSCLVEEWNRGDLGFDIVLQGRYHYHVTALRDYGRTLTSTQYKKWCSAWGLAENLTTLVQMTLALDIIRSRPADLAHSEYASMAKQAQILLNEAILTPQAQKLYATELRRFPFPPS
jgi:hypothetical protein